MAALLYLAAGLQIGIKKPGVTIEAAVDAANDVAINVAAAATTAATATAAH